MEFEEGIDFDLIGEEFEWWGDGVLGEDEWFDVDELESVLLGEEEYVDVEVIRGSPPAANVDELASLLLGEGEYVDGDVIRGRPPAARSVVEILDVVSVPDDVACAVCKNDILLGEEGKQLPCFHLFHGECILPWLQIRNTCPLCRYELPTDDAIYEQRRRNQKG